MRFKLLKFRYKNIFLVLCFGTILLVNSPCLDDIFGQAFGKTSASEDAKTKTLVLNSNRSVKKYSTMQSEFKAKFGKPTIEIDISGSKWADEDWFEDILNEEAPDLIICIGSKAYLLAYKVAKKTDIIFSLGINWRRFPLTKNTYVIASEVPPITTLMMYRYFFPEIKKIGVLYSKKHNKEWFHTAVEEAKEVGMEIVGGTIKKQKEIRTVLNNMLFEVDALWIIPDPVVLSSRNQVEDIFKQCDAMKKPVFAYDKLFADFGAAFIVSADVPTIGGQVAKMATNILDHKEIVDKIQNPAGSYTTIDLEKIEDYGIKVNSRALPTVNDYIQ